MPSKTALIIGASRGLGLGLAREYLSRGWTVIGTVRQPSPSLEAAAREAAGQLRIEALDITAPDQIAALRDRLGGSALDLLFVNAGVANNPAEKIEDVSTEEFTRVMLTNALSPMRVIDGLKDLVRVNGTIAVMSSGLGSVADNESGGWEVYRASKAALNMLMRSLAVRHKSRGWTFLVVAPGWVRTDMGGSAAPLDVQTSMRGVADALAAHEGTGGVAYVNYQNQRVNW